MQSQTISSNIQRITPPLSVAQQRTYRRHGVVFLIAAVLVFAASFGFLMWALVPQKYQHFPAVMWVLTEVATIVLAIIGVGKFKKARPPDLED